MKNLHGVPIYEDLILNSKDTKPKLRFVGCPL